MVQLYLLLDCVDGEVARWKKQFSLGGVYLDRVGAYLCDAAVLVGFGLRAADLWGGGRIDWLWAFLGTLAALGAILIKAETDLVGVARHQGGLPPVKESASEPRSSGMALARRAAAALKFHRLILGIEASLLILLLAVVDQVEATCTPPASGSRSSPGSRSSRPCCTWCPSWRPAGSGNPADLR